MLLVASYYSRLNSALPVVTKTTWKLAPAPAGPSPARPHAGRSTKLILNRPPSQPTPQAPVPPPSEPLPPPASALSVAAQPFQPAIPPPQPDNPASLAPPRHILAPSPVSQAAATLGNLRLAPTLPAPAAAASKPNELVINGVSFVRDTQGKKLVRKTSQSLSLSMPLALIGGTTYVRTKSGNLVELSALKKFQAQRLHQLKRAKLLASVNAIKARYTPAARSYSSVHSWDPSKKTTLHSRHSKLATKVSRPPLIKKNEQCRFFAKTGACRNGLTCVYQHDPSQVAICPRYLRKKCSYSANSCPLSHKPNPHNMEHCSHFPRCNKAECPYPHVKPTTAQICQEFADLGWCSKGAQCAERHVRECPEFSTKGTCSNPGCRLRHMINRNHKPDGDDDEDDEEGEAGHPDDDRRSAAGPGGSSDAEAPGGSGSAGLFFTDLTGSDRPKGKRKAPKPPLDAHPHRAFTGISHNTEVNPGAKRAKYDQMADNSDFVMFISSDEDAPGVRKPAGCSASSSGEDEEEDPSSVDSEELESVFTDHPLEQREEDSIPAAAAEERDQAQDATVPAAAEEEERDQAQEASGPAGPEEEEEDDRPLPTPTHPLPPRPSFLLPPAFEPLQPALIPLPPRPKPLPPRHRAALGPGEEIEEGEIFDDDELPPPLSSASAMKTTTTTTTTSMPSSTRDPRRRLPQPRSPLDRPQDPELSSDDDDDDEIVARLLLGASSP
ncbi:hypothetical protein PtA15_11A338 [Puccinia triticina]|uniref:C3H1-type domain-containing protein n=1 Tax=Puccinia triticina TaxID=208348 RepID=A0ABY7CWH5_9BASI|nr:uncharacterized protein PtA15_11A338 [Puccinia triticina]WAQ89648.1 hypothetical protein PtA15_11A338 [Puccinia triticina]